MWHFKLVTLRTSDHWPFGLVNFLQFSTPRYLPQNALRRSTGLLLYSRHRYQCSNYYCHNAVSACRRRDVKVHGPLTEWTAWRPAAWQPVHSARLTSRTLWPRLTWLHVILPDCLRHCHADMAGKMYIPLRHWISSLLSLSSLSSTLSSVLVLFNLLM